MINKLLSEYLNKLNKWKSSDSEESIENYNDILNTCFDFGEYSLYISEELNERLENKFHYAVFDLSFPIDDMPNLYLLIDTANKCEDIKVLLCNEDVERYIVGGRYNIKFLDLKAGKSILCEQTNLYKKYLAFISSWLKNQKELNAQMHEFGEYLEISRGKLEKSNFNIHLFRDIEFTETLENYAKEDFVKLEDVAEIFYSNSDYCHVDFDIEELFPLWNDVNIKMEYEKFLIDIKQKLNDEIEKCYNGRINDALKSHEIILIEKILEIPLAYNCGRGFMDGCSSIFILKKDEFNEKLYKPILNFWKNKIMEYKYENANIKGIDDVHECSIRFIRFGYIANEEKIIFKEEIEANDILFCINNQSLKVSNVFRPDEISVDDLSFSLLGEELTGRIPDNGTYIIRCHGIDPYYLINYLNSDYFKKMILFNIKYDMEIPTIDTLPLGKIPVLKNNIKNEEFSKNYYEIMNLGKDPVNNYYNIGLETSMNKLVVEFLEKQGASKRAGISNIIKEDINELNICFKNKAYKASMILAGSIMEAILLSWLSHRDGVDYADGNNKIYANGFEATLFDYINMIKELEAPNWMENANKAHEIRKKRNLVHAKLCLKKDKEINEETCNMVLDYLNDIIESYMKYIEKVTSIRNVKQ